MADYDRLCMACMEETDEAEECPHCGFSFAELQLPDALPYRTILKDQYLVGRAMRKNGEGILYIGLDLKTKEKVEIREFFPQTLALRNSDGLKISPQEELKEVFEKDRRIFLENQQALLRFHTQPAMAHIEDVFEENETVYAVAPWMNAITLRYFVKRSGGSLNWNEARQLFMPVLMALSTLHAVGISHLGISPDTLFILPNGSMILGDFCIEQVWRFGTELQDSLVSGCAALEQCEGTAPLRESTDIYGFASSLFFALTGSFPKNALARKEDPRLLIPSSILQNIPPHVVTSLANALQVSAEKRTPTFERMRAELSASPTITATIEETESLRRIPSPVPPQKEERAEKNSDEGHDLKGETSQGAQPVQQPSRPPRSPQMRKNTGHKGKKKIPMFVWTIFVCAVLLIIVTVVVVVRMSSGNNKSQQAIVSQTSEAGTADSETTSAVSSTVAEQITVPNLVNKKYEDNQQSSSDADYQVVVSKHEYSDTVEAGYIISQTPTAGEKMVKGTAISVIVSDGNALITLPDLAGLTAEEAVSVLKSRGFTSVQQENGHSEYVGIGQAYGYKNQNAGDKMAANSTITILINANSSSTSSNG